MAKATKKQSARKARPKKIARTTSRSRVKKVPVQQPEFSSVSTRKLLARPEGFEVDFKRDSESVKQDDLVAFANGGGGAILVGVNEVSGQNGVQRGKVVGCDVSDRERNKIVSRASQCRPAIAVKVTVETYGKHSIFRVDIPKGGLHCAPNGAYKIRRDGQIDIIDPSTMVEIIVRLERKRIIGYLRPVFDSHNASLRAEIEEGDIEAQGAIEDMRAELEEMSGQYEDDGE